MIAFPNIDPVLHLGPLNIRWYAMMYILGFAVTYFVIEKRAKETKLPFAPTDSGDLIAGLIFGLLIGARLGFVLFYKPGYYLMDPFKIFALWEGGMSFHGGFIGVLLVALWFCRKRAIGFLDLCDMVSPAAPLGLALGRLGNFINGELWGKPSTVPWAMVFPNDPTHLPRHPSQLYELLTEGLLLAAVLWGIRNKRLPSGTMLGVFIAGYGCARIFCEFFREPDAELVFGLIPRGMFLSLPMVLGGAALIWWAKMRQPSSPISGEVPAIAEGA
ncbi:MAG: lgt [Cyanobacteria bacterium RYN_339]|nr:lgt [Cyanobacteria bacterium RYN_339]